MLPLLQFIPAYLMLVYFSRRGRLGRGITWLLVWALMLNLVMIGLLLLCPAQSGKIYLAKDFMGQIQQWVKDGTGLEGTSSLFIPHHLKQLGIFGALSLVSAGAASLFLGVVQLDYMNYYVAVLVAKSGQPFKALFFGWHIWSICRVIGYIIICSVLAQPLLGRLFRYRLQLGLWFYLAVGLGFVFLDIFLKVFLNPAWRRAISSMFAS